MTVLIIDAFNLYVRMHYPNLDGGHVDPSIYGCTYLMELIYKNIDLYDKIYIVLDSDKANHDKKKMQEDYKDGRESKKELFKNFNDYLTIISKLPKLQIITNEYREADEIIAHIALSMCKNNRVIIYSNDKDFVHLKPLSKNILLSSNYKDGEFKILTNEQILDKFKDSKKERLTEDIKEVIKWRTFIGDSSDNISSAIKNLPKKKIKEIISAWEEDNLDDAVLANIIMRLDNMELKMKIAENFEKILMNYKLMYLGECYKDFKLKKFTKRVNMSIEKDNYLELLEKYKLYRFKNFLLLRGYV